MTSDLTTKAAEIRTGLVAKLRRAVTTGEDGCGTLPAKEAVKVRPVDWHRITRLAREAAALIEQQAAELAAERQRSDTLRVQRDGQAAELAEARRLLELTRKSRNRWVRFCLAEQAKAETAESERDELLREKERLAKLSDSYGVALMMIRAGCSQPQRFAGNILDDKKPVEIDLEDCDEDHR